MANIPFLSITPTSFKSSEVSPSISQETFFQSGFASSRRQRRGTVELSKVSSSNEGAKMERHGLEGSKRASNKLIHKLGTMSRKVHMSELQGLNQGSIDTNPVPDSSSQLHCILISPFISPSVQIHTNRERKGSSTLQLLLKCIQHCPLDSSSLPYRLCSV